MSSGAVLMLGATENDRKQACCLEARMRSLITKSFVPWLRLQAGKLYGGLMLTTVLNTIQDHVSEMDAGILGP